MTKSPADNRGDRIGPAGDGLWREALRQSPHFDVAAGVEDTDLGIPLVVHIDQAAQVASSTLLLPNSPPVPLASASGELTAALDRLALATRQALGEVDPRAAPVAAIYTQVWPCAELTEQGLIELAQGNGRDALDHLRQARRLDPGCTVTLLGLAKASLALGAAQADQTLLDEARRTAIEALQLPHRLAPTTQHRLAHAALAAQSQDPSQATQLDRELLDLGEAASRERPHDPHARFSKAVALNLLSRYVESAPLLRDLAKRWPQSAEVGYHLTFAELATDHPVEALATIRRVAPRLPQAHAVVPTALALYHAGEHDQLRHWLTMLADDPKLRASPELHSIRRMQAAHALLTDRLEEATRLLLEDLEWIRQRPSELDWQAMDVAEEGEVLVQLGRHRELRLPLQAFEDLGPPPPLLAQALVFLGGLVTVAEQGGRATATEAHLTQGGHLVWSSIVKASAHSRAGELMDELKERLLQYQSTESPLVRAALARVLDASGGRDQARQVRAELRTRLLAFPLRRPSEHPLLSPSAALAWVWAVEP